MLPAQWKVHSHKPGCTCTFWQTSLWFMTLICKQFCFDIWLLALTNSEGAILSLSYLPFMAHDVSYWSSSLYQPTVDNPTLTLRDFIGFKKLLCCPLRTRTCMLLIQTTYMSTCMFLFVPSFLVVLRVNAICISAAYSR